MFRVLRPASPLGIPPDGWLPGQNKGLPMRESEHKPLNTPITLRIALPLATRS